MPNFKEFIKGFEEKPEAEQPKENRDQIIEKVNQKMMNANTYGAFGDKENYEKSIAEAEELRKGLAPKAEPKPQPKEEPKPSNYRQWRSNPENAKREKEADAKYKPMYEELDKKDDELYKAYYYEQDPEKKAELKAQLDENDKKFDALFEEWGEATGYPETPEEKRAWLALRNMSQPKEGSFEKAFGDKDETYEANQRENAKEEGDLVYNEGETNDDYLKGLKIGDEVTIDGKVAQIVPPARVSSTRDKAGKVFFQYRVYPYRTGYIEKDAGEAIKTVTDEERAQAKALDDQARKFGYSSFSDY